MIENNLNNFYKDFIMAVKENSELSRDVVEKLKNLNSRMEEYFNKMTQYLVMEREALDLLSKRSDKVDVLFKKLCASNEQ